MSAPAHGGVAPSTTSPARPPAGQATPPRPAGFTAVLHHGLDAVAPLWERFEAEGLCTAYQRFDWVKSIADGLMPHQDARPFVVEIREGPSGRPVMLLPLARLRRFGHTVLTWLDLGVCDYAAPLIARGFDPSPGQAAALWGAACAVMPRSDLVHFERIPETVGTARNPLAILQDVRPMAMQAMGVPIDGPAETLLKRICSSSANQKFRKAERRLAREGEVRFIAAETLEQVEAIFAALLDQRRQRFRDLGRFDLLGRPEVAEFYGAMARAGLAGGAARLFGLSVDGRWIATAFGLVHGGTFHGILLAMDDNWRHFSPGLRIVTEIMIWARRHEIDDFDFTVGDLPYKAELGARARTLHEFSRAVTLKGLLAQTILQGARSCKTRLKASPALFERARAWRQSLRRWTGR